MNKRIAKKVQNGQPGSYSQAQEQRAWARLDAYPARGRPVKELLEAALPAYDESGAEAARVLLLTRWPGALPALLHEARGRDLRRGRVMYDQTFEAGAIMGSAWAACQAIERRPDRRSLDREVAAVLDWLRYMREHERVDPADLGFFTAALRLLEPGYGLGSYVEAEVDRRACPVCEQPLRVVREPYGPGPRKFRIAIAGDRWCPCLGHHDSLYWADQLDVMHDTFDAGAHHTGLRHRSDPLPRRYWDGPPREDAPATPPWTDADRTKFRVFVARVRDNPCQNGVATDPTTGQHAAELVEWFREHPDRLAWSDWPEEEG